MWKDFLYFSRTQRTAIYVLIAAIAMAVAADYLAPLFIHPTSVPANKFDTEVAAFRKSLQNRDSIRKAMWEQKQLEWKQKAYNAYTYHRTPNANTNYTLFAFDPNTIDSPGLVQLGLKPFMAKNIIKYRKAGGRFQSPADFSKVYGLSAEKFAELQPYITIAELPVAEKKTTKRTDLIIDLNSADTTLLMQIKGIGRGYAFAIIRFRQLAGGFASVAQLADVRGMTTETIEKIKPFCRVDESLIHPIRINTATVEKMKNHPYIGFYKAKNIYELRRRKGKLTNIDELRDLPDITPHDIEQLKPYLSFE